MWKCCTKLYTGDLYLFHPQKLILDLKQKSMGNVTIYSKALYTYTLADCIVNFLHNANIRKNLPAKEITALVASFGVHTAVTCLRLGNWCRPHKHEIV